MNKINETKIKDAVKKILIQEGKFSFHPEMPEHMKIDVNEESWRADIKRRILEEMEGKFEEKYNEISDINKKLIKGFANELGDKLKISATPDSIATEINEKEFEIVWGKAKIMSNIGAILE